MKSDSASGTKPRWMIVDDDAGVQVLLSTFVTQLTNAEIGCFSSPHEAVTAFAEAPEKFQFVITDLEMPGLDGIQVCHRLHAISPKTKILLATGSQLLTSAEAVQKGFCGMLQKPFRVDVMKKVLTAAGMETASPENIPGVFTPA
jgi:DNA-binding NtrC family response regulator